MPDNIQESPFWPVNSLGELIFESGVGDTTKVGYLSSHLIPQNVTTKAVPVAGMGNLQFALNAASEAVAIAYQGKKYNAAILAVAPSGDTTGATDTAAINNALAIVSASSVAKGAVQLTAGQFYVAASNTIAAVYSAINLVSNVDLFSTNGAKIKLMASTQPSGWGGMVVFGTGISNVNIYGLEIDGNRSNFTSPAYASAQDGIAGSGVRLINSTDVTVTGCKIHSNIYHGTMAVEACARIHFDRNTIYDQGYRAMHFNTVGATNTLSDCSFDFNWVYGNGQAADNIDNSGCYVTLGQTNRVRCNFNVIENEAFAGVEIGGINSGSAAPEDWQVIGNIINNCKIGIRSGGGMINGLVMQNEIKGCVTAGILAGVGTNVKYDYNKVSRTVGGGTTGGYGISVGALGTDVLTNCSFDHNQVIDNQGNTSNRTSIFINNGAHVGLSLCYNYVVNNGVTDNSTAGGIQTSTSAGRSKSMRICGNTFKGNKGHAIAIYNSDNAMICWNTMMDNFESSGGRGFAISMSGTADGTTIMGNIAMNDNVSNTAVQFKVDATVTNTYMVDNIGECANALVFQAVSGATGVQMNNWGTQSWPSGFANSTAAPVTKTTTYTVLNTDVSVRMDATSAAFTATLPAIATVGVGKRITFKKVDSSGNAATVKGNASELIDAANTNVLSTQYASITVESNTTGWDIVAKV